MNTLDKGAIGDGFEDVASPIAANEAVSKSDQEDDGIVIATPSESWVLLDSKSDDEEVTLDEASTASRRQPGLIAAAVACALVVAAAGAFAATRPSAVVKPPPPPPPVKRFVLASALDSVAAAAAKVRADGIDAQFELATGLDGKLASAAAVRLEALAKLSAARLDKLDEQYGAQEKLDRAVVVVSDYVENASLSDARKAASGITDVVLGGASSLAVSVFGDAAVERVKEEVVDASAALVGLFPESHRPEAKTLATSVALGLGGLAVGVPFVPGITDNLLVGGVGAALPFLSGEEND
ncbi:unnamed protein product [Pelagomonas calceolata]|uniref:Uncharacterized protein n=1 Tax=Pelagomonas calceolata TaxID=35677 RepID=A0A8J2SH50_9STRA|nr:unnamed protein product [Pelagomonas calceolata]|mmetsp:Transcript_3934/g.11114  ORF Transcript_3934/g.11114 Transcript_3934/m.11114 type:complete len:297 (+) Transcript_3934:175-1065(+)